MAERARVKASVWPWFLDSVRRHPRKSALLVSLGFVNSVADGLSISLLIPFLVLLFRQPGDTVDDSRWAEVLRIITELAGPGRELLAVSLLILGMVTLRALTGYAESLISGWISGRTGAELRSRIHANLLGVDYEFICLNDNGRLLNTLDDQAWRVAGAIASCFGLIASCITAAVFLALLVLVSWQLTVLVAALVGAVSLLMLVFDKRVREIGLRSVGAAETLSERAVELLDAMRMTRAFGRETKAQQAYEEASERLFRISMDSDRTSGFGGVVQEVLYAANFVIVIFFALALDIGGATLIGYLALLFRFQPHVRALDAARMDLASVSGALRAVHKLVELRMPSAPAAGAVLPRLEREIRFDAVSFAYGGKDDESRNALDRVDLSLPIGKVTAVVGWSGAGKSTLINLLYRFHDPQSGTISVDGTPLQALDLGWWRRQLSIAGQDAELINGTIGENILYGNPDASMDDVVEAARRASIDAFIRDLPRGYDTQIGGRGLLLSGGQRQRIGLARALLRRSPVLILDEATNSIDSLTEADILESLEQLRKDSTVIIVAHRVSSTRHADQVIAMADGRVAECGTPQQLLQRDGYYARMVMLQRLQDLTQPP